MSVNKITTTNVVDMIFKAGKLDTGGLVNVIEQSLRQELSKLASPEITLGSKVKVDKNLAAQNVSKALKEVMNLPELKNLPQKDIAALEKYTTLYGQALEKLSKLSTDYKFDKKTITDLQKVFAGDKSITKVDPNEVARFQRFLKEVQAAVNATNKDIASVSKTVADQSVSALKASITSTKRKLTQHKNELKKLHQEMGELDLSKSELKRYRASDKSIQNKINGLNTQLLELQTALDGVGTTKKLLGGLISQSLGNISGDLKSQQDRLKSALDAAEAQQKKALNVQSVADQARRKIEENQARRGETYTRMGEERLRQLAKDAEAALKFEREQRTQGVSGVFKASEIARFEQMRVKAQEELNKRRDAKQKADQRARAEARRADQETEARQKRANAAVTYRAATRDMIGRGPGQDQRIQQLSDAQLAQWQRTAKKYLSTIEAQGPDAILSRQYASVSNMLAEVAKQTQGKRKGELEKLSQATRGSAMQALDSYLGRRLPLTPDGYQQLNPNDLSLLRKITERAVGMQSQEMAKASKLYDETTLRRYLEVQKQITDEVKRRTKLETEQNRLDAARSKRQDRLLALRQAENIYRNAINGKTAEQIAALSAGDRALVNEASRNYQRRLRRYFGDEAALTLPRYTRVTQLRSDIGEALRAQRNANFRNASAARVAQGRFAYSQAGGDVSQIPERQLLGTRDYLKSAMRKQAEEIEQLRAKHGNLHPAVQQAERDQHKFFKSLQQVNEALGGQRGFTTQMRNLFSQFARYAIGYGFLYNLTSGIRSLSSAVVDLEDDLKGIQAVTGATTRQMVQMEDAVKAIATSSASRIGDITDAARVVAQAGTAWEDIPKVVEAMTNLATASGTSLPVAADLITTAQSVWDTLTPEQIANSLTQTANVSKLRVEDLQSIFSLGASMADNVNLSLDQYLDYVAAATNSGVRKSTIATGGGQLFTELFSPDDKLADFLSRRYAAIGETVSPDEARKRFAGYRYDENPLQAALSELRRIQVDSATAMAELPRVMEVRAYRILQMLLRNPTALQDVAARRQAAPTARESAEVAMDSFKKSLGLLRDQIEMFADTIGKGALPALTDMTTRLTSMIKAADEFIERFKMREDSADIGLPVTAAIATGAAAGWSKGSSLLGRTLKAGVGAIIGGTASAVANMKASNAGLNEMAVAGINTLLETILLFQIGKLRGSASRATRGTTSAAASLLGKLTGIFDKIWGSFIKPIVQWTAGTSASQFGTVAKWTARLGTAMRLTTVVGGLMLLFEGVGAIVDWFNNDNRLDDVRSELDRMNPRNRETALRRARQEATKESSAQQYFRDLGKGADDLDAQKDWFKTGLVNLLGTDVGDAQVERAARLLREGHTSPVDPASRQVLLKNLGDALDLDVSKADVGERLSNVLNSATQLTSSQSARIDAVRTQYKELLDQESLGELSEEGKKRLEVFRSLQMDPAFTKVLKGLELSTGELVALLKRLSDASIDRLGKPVTERDQILRQDVPALVSALSRYVSREDGSTRSAKAIQQTLDSLKSVAADGLKAAGPQFLFDFLRSLNVPNLQVGAKARLADLLPTLFTTTEGIIEPERQLIQDLGARAQTDFDRINTAKTPMPAIMVKRPVEELFPWKDGYPPEITGDYLNKFVIQDIPAGVDPNTLSDQERARFNVTVVERKYEAANYSAASAAGELSALQKGLADSLGLFTEVFKAYQQGQAILEDVYAALLAYEAEKESGLKSGLLQVGENGQLQLGKSAQTVQSLSDRLELERQEEVRRREYIPDAEKVKQLRYLEARIAKLSRENPREVIQEQMIEQAALLQEGLYKSELDFIKNQKYYTAEQQQPNNKKEKDIARVEDQIEKTRNRYEKQLEELQYRIDSTGLRQESEKLGADVQALRNQINVVQQLGDLDALQTLQAELAAKLEAQQEIEDQITALRAKNHEEVGANLDAQKRLRELTEHQARVQERLSAFQRAVEDVRSGRNTDPTSQAYSDAYLGAVGSRVSIGEQERRLLNRYGGLQPLYREAQGEVDSIKTKLLTAEGAEREQLLLQLRQWEDQLRGVNADLGTTSAQLQDLNATLFSEIQQISWDSIAAQLNDLPQALRNFNRSLESRVVNAIEQGTGALADAAGTAATSLLGLEDTVTEISQSLRSKLDAEGDYELLVSKNRTALAERISEIRDNITDPERQEILIQQAVEAQQRAEALAQERVSMAQAEYDREQYDQSFVGKSRQILGETVQGVVKDYVQGTLISGIANLFGMGKQGETEQNPLYVHVTNQAPGVPGTDPTQFSAEGESGSSNLWSGVIKTAKGAYNATSDWFSGLFKSDESGSYGTEDPVDTVADKFSTTVGDTLSGDWYSGFTDTMSEGFSSFIDGLGQNFSSFTGALGVLLGLQNVRKDDPIAEAQKWIGIATSVVGGVMGAVGSIGSAAGAAGSAGGGFSAGNISAMNSSITPSFASAGFASGGYVSGPGTTTSDSIPASLSNGEYVLNAKTVRAIGKGVLDAWNFGHKAPIRLATGGYVDSMQKAAYNRQTPETSNPVTEPSGPSSVRVVLVDDQRRVKDYISSPDGERTLIDFVNRNSMAIKQIIQR